jgi:translation initiation factor 5B
MAPKKKGNKKAQDDWEADLGESIAPAAPAAQPENGAPEEDGEEGSGGLMAMLRKNKQKRKDKGLPEVQAAETPEPEAVPQVAQEANVDDEFALPEKKGKGGNKGKQPPKKNEPAPAAADDDGDGTGRVLTKAEKEKLKKEREKQRKKEQVNSGALIDPFYHHHH